MRLWLCTLCTLQALVWAGPDTQSTRRGETGAAMLEVWLVPHTHADTGWELTMDQYYQQLVRPILTTTLHALSKDKSRRYVWAEIAYLSLWWAEQNTTTRSMVRHLALSGQLEFVEAGWCQADELVADVDGRSENLARGHEWLRVNIDASILPRVGWKPDPFGASDLSTALLGKAQGFEFMAQARIPAELKQTWRTSGVCACVRVYDVCTTCVWRCCSITLNVLITHTRARTPPPHTHTHTHTHTHGGGGRAHTQSEAELERQRGERRDARTCSICPATR